MTDSHDDPQDLSVGPGDTAEEPRILPSNSDPSRSNTRSPSQLDPSFTRSPQLSSLPEDSLPDNIPGRALTQTNVADFAIPARQYTDSTTSTSEFSNAPASRRSSTTPFYQPIHSQSSSEHQLQPARQLVEQHAAQFKILKASLRTVPSPHRDQNPRLPVDDDLSEIPEILTNLSWRIRTYKDSLYQSDITSIIIILHDYDEDETFLKHFTRKHLVQSQTAFLVLGGLRRIRAPSSGQGTGLSWADDHADGSSYLKAARLILEQIICKILISKCNFAPSNIALLGQGQGGTLALTIASIWDRTRLGGVITVDGPAPEYLPRPQSPQNPTPVLILGGKLGPVSPQAEQRIKDIFIYVDTELRPGTNLIRLSSSADNLAETRTLQEFLAHSLRQEEWETQTVMAFDGGGIKGYGSLLVLKELMRRVGLEEKRLDFQTESSFYPGIYKPRVLEAEPNAGSRPQTAGSQQRPILPTPTEGLNESDLFLPCHYFTYIGGTSTGGLISIMLSRFRMSVADCITEYKSLGGKVFAHPRILAKGALLWHKFKAKNLHDAIQDVTNRHCFSEKCFGIQFPSDPDFCRTVVLAYSEEGTTDAPFLFRTYKTFPRPRPSIASPSIANGEAFQPGLIRRPTTMALKNTPIHNPGQPSAVDIPLVGRATSAAPTYFPPVRIPITDNKGTRSVRFKDGGFGSNNPSPEIYHDVVHKHGGFSKNVGVFVSIGTGDSELRAFGQEGWTRGATRIREAIATMKASHRLPARTKGADNAMRSYSFRDNEEVFPYSRFDGGPRLGKIEMDEWKSDRFKNLITGKQTVSGGKTLQEIEDAVAVYLADPAIQAELDERAKQLVHRRRRRMRDKSKWDRYASASWYECQMGGCRDSTEYKTYTSFEEHVRKEHSRNYDPEKFEEEALNHRKCWLYGQS